MKRFMIIVAAVLMVLAFSACGGKDFEWTRLGDFQADDGTLLTIMEPQEGMPEGYYVGMFMPEEFHGWYIPVEGESLHGNLVSEYDDYDGDFIVTVTEEGEDGVQVEIEGRETLHFTPKPHEDKTTLRVNTWGIGEVAFAREGEEIQFDDEYPMTSHYINADPGSKFIISARTQEEGWHFVRWMRNGEAFSEEPEITVEVTDDVEYEAVFDVEGSNGEDYTYDPE